MFETDPQIRSLVESNPQLADYLERILEENNTLANKNRTLNKILSSVQDIAFTLDSNMRHTGVYGTWISSMGLSPDDFIGKTFRDILGDEGSKVHENAFSIAMDGEFVIYDWSVANGDRTNYYQTSLSPMYSEKGEVEGLIGIGRDMTLVMEKERKVEETLEMLSKITYQVPGVVYQYKLNPDGRSCFPYSSAGMLEIYGHTPEEVREDASPVFERLHPDDRERVTQEILESAENLTFFHTVFRVVLPGKGVQWRSSNARPERLSDGGTLWYGIITDITEEKISQNRLQKLSQAVEQSPASVVITDLDGNIEYVNSKFMSVTGFNRDEVVGKNPRILKSGAQSLEFYQKLWGTITSGATWHGEMSNRRKNGEIYWESASISPIKNSLGEITHFLGIKEDITHRKMNEFKLKESEQRLKILLKNEEEQNRRLRNFTHIVSHNMRSHTANLEGLLSLIEMESPDLLDNPYIKMLSDISLGLTETIQNINEVLDINLNSNKKRLWINLYNVIEEVSLALNPMAKSGNVKIFNSVPKESKVYCVPEYLTSIMMNLISNSINFRSESRDSFVKVSVQSLEDCHLIEVEDNGVGIDLKRHKAKLFDMYKVFHTQKETKGLGLFLIKNQVESMSGRIDVESEPDHGTKFKICIPNSDEKTCLLD